MNTFNMNFDPSYINPCYYITNPSCYPYYYNPPYFPTQFPQFIQPNQQEKNQICSQPQKQIKNQRNQQIQKKQENGIDQYSDQGKIYLEINTKKVRQKYQKRIQGKETGIRKKLREISESYQVDSESSKVSIKKNTTFKKRIRQTPNRNVTTNMCNKLINFITNKKKSKVIIQRIHPEWRQYEFKSFYSLCNRLKNEIGSYTNLEKFGNIWLFQEPNNSHRQFYRVIRILAKHYLNQIYVLIILNSRRIKKDAKIFHLKAKVQFLRKLKYSN